MPLRERLRRTFSTAQKPSSPSTNTSTSSTSITVQHLSRLPSNLPSTHFVPTRAPPSSPTKGAVRSPSPDFRSAFPPAITKTTTHTITLQSTNPLKRSATNPNSHSPVSNVVSHAAGPGLVRSLSQRAAATTAATTTLLGRPLKRSSSKQNPINPQPKEMAFAKPNIVTHAPPPGPPNLKPSPVVPPAAVKPIKPSRKQRKALEKAQAADPLIPRLKYRAVVDRQHMAALRAYSIGEAFATARPRSVWSGVSPKATRQPSLGSMGSMNTRRGSWDDNEAEKMVNEGGDGVNVRHSLPVSIRPPRDRKAHTDSTSRPIPPPKSPLTPHPSTFRYSMPVTTTSHVDAGRVDAPLPPTPRPALFTSSPTLPRSPFTQSPPQTPLWFSAPASALSTKRTSRTGPSRLYKPTEDSFLLFNDNDDDDAASGRATPTAAMGRSRDRSSAFLRPRSRIVVERAAGIGRMSGASGGTGATILDVEMDRMLEMLAVGKA